MKRIIKVGALAASSFSLLFLTGCSSNNQEVAQYGDKKISQEQFYQELKSSPTSKTILANMLIYGALKEAYGSKLNKDQVEADYNSYKKRYGSQFDSFLKENSYTKKSFKQMIELNYLSKIALKKQMKPTTSQLKEEWKDYQPKITVQHISTTSRDTANTVIEKLNNGESFASLASKYSVDSLTSSNGGKLSAFDMQNRRYDSTFKKAAYKLKNDEYAKEPIKVTNGYEVIKMINHPKKGNFADKQKELTDAIYNKWASNSRMMNNVISQVLKEQHVSIKDKDLESALDMYKGSNKANF